MLDLRDPDYWCDPYPVLARERAAGRTTVTHRGEPALLSAEDVEHLHTDPHFLTPGVVDLELLGIVDGPFYEWRKRSLNALNGADHLRLRNLVGKAFYPRQIDRLRSLVRDRTQALLDRAVASGTLDFDRDFAADLPLWTMCRFLGIDEADRFEIAAFLTGTEEGFTQAMTPALRVKVEASITALNDYVADLVERRSQAPQDDIVSTLIGQQHEGDGPAPADMLALIVNLIGGAVGSTRAALNNSIVLFAQFPGEAEHLREQPTLIRQAVEECLRIHAPFRVARRVAVAPVAAFGLDFKPGDSVFVPRQAANRDPARWENPDTFDIDRPERRHLSFGFGAHFCLGQAIARANLQESLPIILDRLRDIELTSPIRRVPFTMDERLETLQIGFRAGDPIAVPRSP